MGVYFDSNVMAFPQRLAPRDSAPEVAVLLPESDVNYHVTMLAENDRARTWLDARLLKYLSNRGYSVTGGWHLIGHYNTQGEADAVVEWILEQQPKALTAVFPLRKGEVLPLEKMRPRSLKPSGRASEYQVVRSADLDKLINDLRLR